MTGIESLLGQVAAGQDLSAEQMSDAIEAIVAGRMDDGPIGLLLSGLAAKGETAEELAGVAAALRRHMVPIRTRHTTLVDTCGTGGDGLATFNISTAAAIVTAAAGVPVAKHGNRAVTSKSGSADVLAALGVNVQADVENVQACLDELGICFCFAPLLHPSMGRVAAVRKKLGVPTIFNLVGPLSNPASAPYQLLGVSRPEHRALLAEALGRLNVSQAVVVHGDDGLDEVTLAGTTHATRVDRSGQNELTWTAASFGLSPAPLDSLRVDGPQMSAEIIRNVFAGQPGVAREIVVINAAAALFAARQSDDLGQLADRAAAAIDGGAARQLLADLAERSHS